VVASLVNLSVELKQGEVGRWAGYAIQAGDETYLENIDYDIGVKAEGYATAAEIWQAVRDNRGYAVIDRLAVPSRTTTNIMIGGPDFKLQGVYLEDETMKPIQLEVRDPNSGAIFEVTIIGVLEQSSITGFGLISSQETLERGLNLELPTPTYFVRLAEGVDPGSTSAALESAFLKHGLESIDQVLNRPFSHS
jgi:hypothetical protein